MNLSKKEEWLSRLRLMDDRFMKQCFQDRPDIVEMILKIIFDTEDIQVSKSYTQDYLANINGKSVVLDIVAEDTYGKFYDIEMQKEEKGASIKRVRYISASLDKMILDKGRDYKELPDTYVIFFTETDYFKKDKQMYHVDKILREDKTLVDDGMHIIYINTSYKSKNKLGKLCEDILCSNPDKMNYEVLKKVTNYYKKGEWRDKKMNGVFEEIFEEGKQEGMQQGILKGSTDILDSLVKDGILTREEADRKLELSKFTLDINK